MKVSILLSKRFLPFKHDYDVMPVECPQDTHCLVDIHPDDRWLLNSTHTRFGAIWNSSQSLYVEVKSVYHYCNLGTADVDKLQFRGGWGVDTHVTSITPRPRSMLYPPETAPSVHIAPTHVCSASVQDQTGSWVTESCQESLVGTYQKIKQHCHQSAMAVYQPISRIRHAMYIYPRIRLQKRRSHCHLRSLHPITIS